MSRDALIASVITTEVFAKHRKALLLFGVQHLFHPAAYEKDYPGRTLVIDTHNGFAAFFDLQRGHELEAQMKSWPVPSIVTMKGSWLGDLDLPYFLWPFPKRLAGQSITGFVDAYLYLGPGESLTYEPTPDAILNDDAYMAVLTTRFSINPAALRTRNLERALFTAADRAEARQFAPGADCVGTYAKDANRPPAVVIDFKRGVLAARVGSSTTWTPLTAGDRPLSYRAGGTTFEFESVAGTVRRLTLDPGESTGKTILVRR